MAPMAGGIPIHTLCPACGPSMEVDEDGCCENCGATAMGDGVEQVYRMMEELKSLLSRIATLEAEAARVGPLVAAAEAYRDVCAPVKGSDVAAAELTGYLEADEALIAAALALPVRP